VRIVHVIPGLGTGGAEIVLAALAETLAPATCMHHVVVPSRGTNSENFVSDRLRDAGAQITALGTAGIAGHGVALRNLRRLIRAERPQLIHGWMHYGNLAATIASWGLPNQKHLWAIHQSFNGYSREKPRARLGIRIAARLSSRPDAIVYVSRAAAEQHQTLGFSAANAVVIPNGIDCQRFSPKPEIRSLIRRELGFDEKHLIVGMVARFHPMKDHHTFLQAAASVSQRVPGVRFVLVGHGMDLENTVLAGMISACGVRNSTVLLGERHDLERLYNAFDVLASSSSWGEAFPLVLCEAMACGVPCVTTDVGDSGFIVGDRDRTVPPRNPTALGSALLRLLEADQSWRRAAGAIGRARIAENFSLAAMARRYAELYRALLHG